MPTQESKKIEPVIEFTIRANGNLSPTSPSADVRAQIQDQSLKTIEVIIDASQLLGGIPQQSILGRSLEYLPKSEHFTLSHFEPLEGGKCKLVYVKVIE